MKFKKKNLESSDSLDDFTNSLKMSYCSNNQKLIRTVKC